MRTVLDTDYIIGLSTTVKRMLILVDIYKLMSSAKIGLLK
jgi:purine-binding chemotaxis protein CheW